MLSTRHSISRSGTGYDGGMWINPFNKKSEDVVEESKDELDVMAESARREIEALRKSKQPEEENDLVQDVIDANAAIPVNRLGQINSYYGAQGQVVYGNSMIVGSTGGSGGTNNVVMGVNNYESLEQHHNQGVCQDSYDKGYEDGLAAGKAGDDSRK